MVVLGDADLDTASSAAVWGSMMNAGQTCISVERCYVHRSIYSRFLARCLDKISKLKVGDGSLPDTDLGPLISSPNSRSSPTRSKKPALWRHRPHRRRALAHLGPNFYAPTLITDLDHSMSLMREETFGPVLPVMPFSSDEEAIALANDSNFGLAASVWGNAPLTPPPSPAASLPEPSWSTT